MSELASTIILGVGFLIIKHTLGDFFLQTEYQLNNKGKYGHAGGLVHAGIHIGLTIPLFYLVPAVGGSTVLTVLIGEFALHYHIDWAKEQIVSRYKLTVDDPRFWRVFGLDQMAHGITYAAIMAVLVSTAS